MSYISLEKNIRTCKVDTGQANRMESDRFLNPNNMLCPPWNGIDGTGRTICADSYYTKTPGCNSAADRVVIENALRPQYMQYVTLDASGITGPECEAYAAKASMACRSNTFQQAHNQTGQFGLTTGFSQNIIPNCMSCNGYSDMQASVGTAQSVQNAASREAYSRALRRGGRR